MIAVFPDGNMPKDAPQHTVNPDMSWSKPETGKSAVGVSLRRVVVRVMAVVLTLSRPISNLTYILCHSLSNKKVRPH
jgi:hypothetical protein